MIKHTIENDLCLLILLPANDTARKYCNQMESSLLCQIQIDSNHSQKGLIYTSIKRQQSIERKMSRTASINLVKPEYKIKHNSNSNSTILQKKSSLCLRNSFKNLTIDKRNNKPSENLIKRRQVKINKKFLSLSSSSPITDSNILHTFNLWYNNEKKNATNG